MIERLWLHPSGVATLAIMLSVLLWRVCALAMWASSVHSAFASVPAATFSFLNWYMHEYHVLKYLVLKYAYLSTYSSTQEHRA